MEKLLLELQKMIRNYPDYDEVMLDEKKNIVIKRKIYTNDANRDRITKIVKQLMKNDTKWQKK